MDKNKLTNSILTSIYIPLSLFGLFSFMGIDALLGETNQLMIIWTYIYSYTAFFTFAICICSMLLSGILYRKNHVVSSYIVKFIPIYFLVLMLLIDKVITLIL